VKSWKNGRRRLTPNVDTNEPGLRRASWDRSIKEAGQALISIVSLELAYPPGETCNGLLHDSHRRLHRRQALVGRTGTLRCCLAGVCWNLDWPTVDAALADEPDASEDADGFHGRERLPIPSGHLSQYLFGRERLLADHDKMEKAAAMHAVAEIQEMLPRPLLVPRSGLGTMVQLVPSQDSISARDRPGAALFFVS
jgi:hypothetical protein